MSSSLETAKEGEDITVFNQYIRKMSHLDLKNEPGGIIALINACISENECAAKLDEVAAEYDGSYIAELAVFNKFKLYLNRNDASFAKDVRTKMNVDFPKSELTLMANRELSSGVRIEESQVQKAITELNELPEKFALSQNYPNPFNPVTHIQLDLPQAAQVKLEVFNIQGQRVATLIDGYRDAGRYQVLFDGRNLASGVYFYRVYSSKFTAIKRMLLVR